MTRTVWLSLLLLALASVAGVVVISVVDNEDSDLGTGSLLIANLDDRAGDLDEILLEFPGGDEVSDTDTGSGVGVTKISLWNDGRRWRLREHHDYFADVGAISAMVIGLAETRLQEAKTAIRDKHERLGLGAPADGGSAVKISLYDKNADVIAEVLLGNEAVSRAGRYVRRVGEDQTWLANAVMERLPDEVDLWLAKPVLDIPGAQVSSITFTSYLEGGDGYALARLKASELLSITPPEGYQVTDPRSVDDWGKVLEDLSFQNVIPGKLPDGGAPEFEVDFRADAHLYDGITVSVEVGRAYDLSDDPVMRLSFSVTDPGAAGDEAYDMADKYKEFYSSWVYEIDSATETRFIFNPDIVFSEATAE